MVWVVAECGVDGLKGDIAAQFLIMGAKHFAHAAFADLLQNTVMPD